MATVKLVYACCSGCLDTVKELIIRRGLSAQFGILEDDVTVSGRWSKIGALRSLLCIHMIVS